MKKIKKLTAVIMTIVMLLTVVPLTGIDFMTKASALDGEGCYDIPSAILTATPVIRTASKADGYGDYLVGNQIVMATPSGVPYTEGDYANEAYSGETPEWPSVTFECDRSLAADSVSLETNISDAQIETSNPSDTKWVWTIKGGTITAGTFADFTVSYSYTYTDSLTGKTVTKDYKAYASSYVDNVLQPAGMYISAERSFAFHSNNKCEAVVRILGQNTKGSYYPAGEDMGTDEWAHGVYDFQTKQAIGWGNTAAAYPDGGTVLYKPSKAKTDANTTTNTTLDYQRPVSSTYIDTSKGTALDSENINLRYSAFFFDEYSQGYDSFVNNIACLDGEKSYEAFNPEDSAAAQELDFALKNGDITYASTCAGGNEPTVYNTSNEFAVLNSADSGKVLALNIPFRGTDYANSANLETLADGNKLVKYTFVNAPSQRYYIKNLLDKTAKNQRLDIYNAVNLNLYLYNKAELRSAIEAAGDVIGAEWLYDNTDGSYDTYLAALTDALHINAKYDTNQNDIDAAADALNAAVADLKIAQADYTAANEALARYNSLNAEDYDEDLWAAVEAARTALDDLDYTVLYQPLVDRLTADLTAAMDVLTIEPADFTGVDEALAAAAEIDLSLYSAESTAAFNELIDLANSDEFRRSTTSEQEYVDSIADAIFNMIDNAGTTGQGGLEYALADYSAVNSAIASASFIYITREYSDRSLAKLTAAINAVVYDLDITHQAEVDAMADAINYALDTLVELADYTVIDVAVDRANHLNPEKFTEETWAAVEAALAAVMYDLDDTHQGEVNEMAEAINCAIDALVAFADYSAVRVAVKRAENRNPDRFTEESWAAVEAALAAVVYKLDYTHQDEVDAMADRINAAIDGLVCKIISGEGSYILSSATLTATPVIRTAEKVSGYGDYIAGNTIVQATPSGVPYTEGKYANEAYSGETPEWPTVTFESDFSLANDRDSVTLETNISDAQIETSNPSDTKWVWTIKGGTISAGTFADFTVSYSYTCTDSLTGKTETKDYKAYASSYVDNVLQPAGMYISAERSFPTHSNNKCEAVVRILGQNTKGSYYSAGEDMGSSEWAHGVYDFQVGGSNGALGWNNTATAYPDGGTVLYKPSKAKSDGNITTNKTLDCQRPVSSTYIDTSMGTALDSENINLRYSAFFFCEHSEEYDAYVGNTTVLPGEQSFDIDNTEEDAAAARELVFDLSHLSSSYAYTCAGKDKPVVYNTSNPYAVFNSADSGKVLALNIPFRGTGYASSPNLETLADGNKLVKYTFVNAPAQRYYVKNFIGNEQSRMLAVHNAVNINLYLYNKAELRSAIEAAGDVIGAEWLYDNTDGSYDTYLAALKNALHVNAKYDTNQNDINAAAEALNEAVADLNVAMADYTAANEALARYNSLNSEDYTAESWAAVEAAKAALGDMNYTIFYQPLVDDLTAEFVAAMEALVRLESEASGTNNFFEYIIKDGKAIITGINDSAPAELVVPSEIEGCPVTKIYGREFCNNILEQISESISWDQFVDLCPLTGVKSFFFIDDEAIGVKGSRSITIPDSVTSIGSFAFIDYDLTSLTIPETVTDIEDYAFLGCYTLESVTLPENKTSIGKGEYLFCKNLKTLTIPGRITSIGESAFEECDSLTDVYFCGTEEEWNAITIGKGNDCLLNANIHFLTEPADYTAVFSAIDYANGFNPNDYTDESWANLMDAINAVVYDLDITHQDEIDAMACRIFEAIDTLDTFMHIPELDFSELDGLLNEVAGLDEHDYTPESWANLERTIDAVEALGVGSITQPVVDNAVAALRAAIDALEKVHTHTLSHVVVPSTCAVQGEEYDICDKCGQTMNQNILPLAEHTWGKWIRTLDPTTQTEGIEERTCSVCGAVETRFVEKLNEIVDEETGISIAYSDEFTEGVEVDVVEEFDGTSFQILSADYDGNIDFRMYDITPTLDGEKVQPNGTVTVRIPVPAQFNGTDIFVVYVNSEDGTTEDLPCTVVDGYIEFRTTHFSHYAICQLINAVRKIKLSDISLKLNGEKALSPKITADNGVSYTVRYESYDPSIAEVDADGTVHGIKNGKTSIRCIVTDEYGNTESDICNVTVRTPFIQWILRIFFFGFLWMK